MNCLVCKAEICPDGGDEGRGGVHQKHEEPLSVDEFQNQTERPRPDCHSKIFDVLDQNKPLKSHNVTTTNVSILFND